MRPIANVFLNYGLQKTQSDKCLKSAVSEYLLTSKMVNVPEHCSNLNDGTFIIYIDYCENY